MLFVKNGATPSIAFCLGTELLEEGSHAETVIVMDHI
jgi:hypothetical protein